VEFPVVVEVCPGHRTVVNSGQRDADEGKAGASVPPELSNPSGAGIAAEDQIKPPVVVVIAPSDRAILNSRQICAELDKSGLGVQPNLRDTIRTGVTSDDEIKPAVIVKISPSCARVGYRGKRDRNQRKNVGAGRRNRKSKEEKGGKPTLQEE